MTRNVLFALALFLLLPAPATPDQIVSPLNLHRVFFVEGPENSQPSGLTIRDGELYTISDKHDGWIYRIALRDEVAALEPSRKIDLPLWSGFGRMDFEGISHDAEGNFYLASETRFRILKVPDGGEAEWITPSLESFGKEHGLFKVKNAYLEAIAGLSPTHFVLCAERQPRGFLDVDLSGDSVEADAYPYNRSEYTAARERGSFDFSGLCRCDGRLYVLERNAFLVSRLERVNGQYKEESAWSYRHVETSERFRYADMRYGKAEGLCIDDRFVYIILDNNGDAFANDPDDRRPLLLVFEKPEGMAESKD